MSGVKMWLESPLNVEASRQLWLYGLAEDSKRSDVYKKLAEKKASTLTSLDDVKYDSALLEISPLMRELRFHLEPENFPLLWQDVKADSKVVKELAIKYHILNKLETYQEGLVQLVAKVLTLVGDTDGKTSFLILQLLFAQAKNFLAGLRDEVYTLVDVMVAKLPLVCANLNKCGFTVSDLGDILCMWTGSLFAVHFSYEIYSHLLDIILLEGCEHLMGFVYSALILFKSELKRLPPQQMYQFITDIPVRLNTSADAISDVFRVAYGEWRGLNVDRNANTGRWMEMTKHSGLLIFSEQGYEDEDEAADFSEDSEEAEQMMGKLESLAEEDEDEKSLTQQDSQTRSDDAALRRQQAIVAHEQEILDLKRKLSSANQALKQYEAKSTKSGKSKHAETKKPSVVTHDITTTPKYANTTLGKPKLPPQNGLIKYSNLHMYQTYPCETVAGYLKKRRMSPSWIERSPGQGMWGAFRYRYFMLQGAFLTYFKNHTTKTPTKDLSVDMRGRNVTRMSLQDAIGIRIDTYDGQALYVLLMQSLTEQDTWMAALTKAAGLP